MYFWRGSLLWIRFLTLNIPLTVYLRLAYCLLTQNALIQLHIYSCGFVDIFHLSHKIAVENRTDVKLKQ
ncbi:hypothetical protein ACF0H5_003997 [Mactra antiquata]